MVPILIELKKNCQLSISNNNNIADINDDDNDFQDLFDDNDVTTDEEEENEQVYTLISIDIDEIKNNLYNAMNHYWSNLTSPSSLLPSLLDPRCKNLSFVSFAKWFTTENLLRDEYEKMKNNIDKEKKNVRTKVKSTSVKKKTKSSILSSFKKHTPVMVEEISNYLKLEEIDIECNPFVW
ncbi:11506_t:CDS:1 [Racocetra persica]|uniref:11506_t:CDS:1 n=1 Tax=Racocetra persica TaxID=160502 RepID=A0ACA9QQ01_9GLOM|nr:11506_t:CDS:1 [Racocetra persica]